MSNAEERSYLLRRERACRQAAESADDPSTRKVHLQMAVLYARRAEELVVSTVPTAS